MEQATHWQNKVLIGQGNLQKFSEDYEKINNGENMFVSASQLFPISIKNEVEFAQVYEYVIYYKVNPRMLQALNPLTGKVEQIKIKMELI
jgi:hypothetical protein